MVIGDQLVVRSVGAALCCGGEVSALAMRLRVGCVVLGQSGPCWCYHGTEMSWEWRMMVRKLEAGATDGICTL